MVACMLQRPIIYNPRLWIGVDGRHFDGRRFGFYDDRFLATERGSVRINGRFCDDMRMHLPTPTLSARRPFCPTGPDYLSTPGSEASGPMLSFSPPLPFACTPRPPSASGLSRTSGSSTSERSAGRATPPISGRDSSALQLARYPSFSMSMDPKAAARASISPVTESPHSMSPPQHYLVMNRVGVFACFVAFNLLRG